MNGAQILIKTLVNRGIEFFYTTSNSCLKVLYDAAEAEKSIKIITAESGASAASMADAYTRLTGKTGVVFSATPAEARWVATGIASSWGDKIPVMSIAAHKNKGKISTSLQDLNDGCMETLFRSITKWNTVIREWEKIPLIIQWGIQQAQTGTPGPVHLDISLEFLLENREITDNELTQILPKGGITNFKGKTRGDSAKIHEAIKLLLDARKPFVLAGGGILASESWKELLEFVEYLNIPICETTRAVSIIPADHPCYIGGPSFIAGLSFHKAILHSDVVLAVGCAFSELEGFGQAPFWSPDIRFIHVDINPLQIGKNTNVEVAIAGDAKYVLTEMLEYAKGILPAQRKEQPWLKKLRKIRKQWFDKFSKEIDPKAIPIDPAYLAKEIRRLVERDAILVSEPGTNVFWVGTYCKIPIPNTILNSCQMATLGYALPMAIAAKLLCPEKRVVCTSGDGASLFNIQELVIAKKYNLPIIIFLFNDSAWTLIKIPQTYMFGGKYLGTQLPDIDYAEIARGFGCFGERIENPKDIEGAYSRAVESGLPAILDIVINRDTIPEQMASMGRFVVDGIHLKLKRSLVRGFLHPKVKWDKHWFSRLRYLLKTFK